MQSLVEEREKRGKLGPSIAGYPQIRLGAKDGVFLVKIRFLTDVNEFEWAYFHSVPTATRTGKRFRRMVYCLQQDGQDCQFCGSNDEEIRKASKRLFFWVWNYEYYHKEQDADKKWKKVEYLGDIYFVEPVNKPMILDTGPGQAGTIELKFMQWAKRFKTYTDRDYDWSRQGTEMKDTIYDLVPRDDGKTKMSEEIRKASENLDPLSKVIERLKPVVAGEGNGEGEDKDEQLSDEEREEQLEKVFGGGNGENTEEKKGTKKQDKKKPKF